MSSDISVSPKKKKEKDGFDTIDLLQVTDELYHVYF